MPQLDLYTFPTQLYSFAVFFFFCSIFTIKFLFTVWFSYELLEKEEIRTLSDVFFVECFSSFCKKTDIYNSRRVLLMVFERNLITSF